jgi:hypothetical protein
MREYSLSHLSDDVLVRDCVALVTKDRALTAALLAHLAEIDARRLFLPKAYSSMHEYCVEELGMSEDSAFKRIRAARTARRFPLVFTAVADGGLNLTAIVLLTPYLTEQNANELLHAAMRKTKSEVERLIAERFPQPELMGLVEVVPGSRAGGHPAPGALGSRSDAAGDSQLVPEPVTTPALRSRVAPAARPAPDAQRAPHPRAREARGPRARW